jgi:hypothetical protein
VTPKHPPGPPMTLGNRRARILLPRSYLAEYRNAGGQQFGLPEMFPAPDFQVWMPLVVAGLLLWFLYLWLTRERP